MHKKGLMLAAFITLPAMLLLLPTLALLLASLSFAARIDLSRDAKNNATSFKGEMQYILNKYAAISNRHHNRTGEHLNIVNMDYVNKQKRAIGKTSLRRDKAWSGTIQVGFPPQKALVVFDTGSSDLVIDKSSYHPKLSLTSKKLNKKFDFSYESLHVYGDLYTDKVAIGGVKARDVPIGHGKEDFDGDSTGGTFGLSFAHSQNSGFEVNQKPFIWAAKKQHLIQSSTYQFTLRPNGGASLNVGKVDLFELGGLITWTDKNTDKTFWRISVELNGNKIHNAIADTGTNVIAGPNEEVKELLDKLDGISVEQSDDGSYQGYYSCKNPPHLSFKVAGQTFKFPEAAMNFGRDGDKCLLSIFGTPGMQDWILGSPFFEIASVILNYDVGRMGFAKYK